MYICAIKNDENIAWWPKHNYLMLDLLPKANAKYWVAALVQMNSEKKVSSMLTKLGYLNYVPIQTEIRQWSDRKKKIEKVVIPMVVFIWADK